MVLEETGEIRVGLCPNARLDPQEFLPGTEMEIILESEQARADVIAYLIAAGNR